MTEKGDPLTYQVIGAAIDVHRELGPGLLESAYEHCLCHELTLRGLSWHRQVPLPVTYKDVRLQCGYRMDIVVSGQLIVELKTVDQLTAFHEAQLLTYLKLSHIRTGLLLNFRASVLKEAIKRLVL